MPTNTEDFRKELQALLADAEERGFVAVDVKSGNLHRRVGGYPGQEHRMPICCDAMYAQMKPSDVIVSKPDSGKGASVVIRYKLPREKPK